MTKKFLITALTAMALVSCSDDKAQEKSLLDSIIKVHDKVMASDAVIMSDKTKLQSLSAAATLQPVKDSATVCIKSLVNADDAMMTWMNAFNPDFAGKTHQETMDYLQKQKDQIDKINARIDSAISTSNTFLSKAKK